MQIYVRHNSPIQQHVTKCLPQNIGLEEIYTDLEIYTIGAWVKDTALTICKQWRKFEP